jgi:hypothetical protein
VKQSESPPVKKDDNEEDDDTNDSGGLMGFLQLLQAMSGGAIRAPTGNEDGDGIQGLLARLGIVTRKFHFLFSITSFLFRNQYAKEIIKCHTSSNWKCRKFSSCLFGFFSPG